MHLIITEILHKPYCLLSNRNFLFHTVVNSFLLHCFSGYFAVDPDSTPEKLVFNRTVTLRDSYGKAGK